MCLLGKTAGPGRQERREGCPRRPLSSPPGTGRLSATSSRGGRKNFNLRAADVKPKVRFFLFRTRMNITAFLPRKTENKNQGNLQKRRLVNSIGATPRVTLGNGSILCHQALLPLVSHNVFPLSGFFRLIVWNPLERNDNIGVFQARGKGGSSTHALLAAGLLRKAENRGVLGEPCVPRSLFSAVAKVSEEVSE